MREEIETVIYTPGSSLRNPVHLLKEMFRDVWKGRELAWRLTVRDINAQYRQAALGILWAFILPLANTLIWLFLKGSGIVDIEVTELPYPVYVFSGTILWAVFMDALNAPLQQSTAAKSMLTKVNFPREALIVSGIYQTLFNAIIKIALLLVVLVLFGIYPGWSVLLLPLAILSLVLAGTVVGLFMTPVGLLYTDIGKFLPLLMQFFMFLTPVVFPMPTTGLAATVFNLNPMTPLILTARDWVTGYPVAYISEFLWINILLLLLLGVAWIVYRSAMPILIERMSA